ncbi:nuclear transport factor 2 family protein [Maribacter sp. ANRC-HE7]|uniref:Nuclear transport factor 2 family protein n=1 Tax=Maribacter aquimaris TaxID=2737171 RepID=A0ABR7UVU7_9FLAO|nr:nuclear transport factor 2 family protein [Maribacter aquimaris]MBD0776488.1 nuclear transport factor 2 family protein [Maribacter aquimaris]
MKKWIPLVLLLVFMDMAAQVNEEAQIRHTIEAFFEGFHSKDSVLMKQSVMDGVITQTIGASKDGKEVLKAEDFNSFLKSIVQIPDSVDFQERIRSFNIQIDGALANAWTPYEFWYNGNFSHCGVNSFQLFKDNGNWKIIYLIDTRRREGCEQ